MPQEAGGGSAAPPGALLMQAMNGYLVSQAIYVAAKLGIADLLADGPKSCEALARAAGADERSLRRLLRALVSLGLFTVDEREQFRLTTLSSCLLSGVQGSVRASVLSAGEEMYRAWGDLLYSVRTGKPAFDHVFGLACYEYLKHNADSAQSFDASMDETAAPFDAVVAACDLSGVETVIDVGGGHGAFLAAMLKANPDLRAILFDAPHVVADAPALLAAAGVAGRCAIRAGDFFRSVPGGADACILVRTLLNWDEEHALTILRNCHRALPSDGKLIVVEPVLPPSGVSGADAFNDLHLLVMNGGGMATEAGLRALFAAAGFDLTRIMQTASRLCAVEGRPVMAPQRNPEYSAPVAPRTDTPARQGYG